MSLDLPFDYHEVVGGVEGRGAHQSGATGNGSITDMFLHVSLRKESSQLGISVERHQSIDMIEGFQTIVVQRHLITSGSSQFYSKDLLSSDWQ